MFQTPIALHAIGDIEDLKKTKQTNIAFQTPIALHAIGDIVASATIPAPVASTACFKPLSHYMLSGI